MNGSVWWIVEQIVEDILSSVAKRDQSRTLSQNVDTASSDIQKKEEDGEIDANETLPKDKEEDGEINTDKAFPEEWIPFHHFLTAMYISELGLNLESSRPMAEANVRTIVAKNVTTEQIRAFLESVPFAERAARLKAVMKVMFPSLLKYKFVSKVLCMFFKGNELKPQLSNTGGSSTLRKSKINPSLSESDTVAPSAVIEEENDHLEHERNTNNEGSMEDINNVWKKSFSRCQQIDKLKSWKHDKFDHCHQFKESRGYDKPWRIRHKSVSVSRSDENFVLLKDYLLYTSVQGGMKWDQAIIHVENVIDVLKSRTHFDELEEGYIRRFKEQNGNLLGLKFSIAQSLKGKLVEQNEENVSLQICKFFQQNRNTLYKIGPTIEVEPETNSRVKKTSSRSNLVPTEVINEWRRRKQKVTLKEMYRDRLAKIFLSTRNESPKGKKRNDTRNPPIRTERSLESGPHSPIRKKRKLTIDYNSDREDTEEIHYPKAKNKKPIIEASSTSVQPKVSSLPIWEFNDLVAFLYGKVGSSMDDLSKEDVRNIIAEIITALQETCGLDFLSLQLLYIKNVASVDDRSVERSETRFLTELAITLIDNKVIWSYTSLKSSHVLIWVAAFFSQDLETKKKVENYNMRSREVSSQRAIKNEMDEEKSRVTAAAAGKEELGITCITID